MTLEEFSKLVKSKKGTTVYRGVTPLSLLGVAFIVLKLIGYITWSWWWVLAPFWIPIGIALLLLGICLVTLLSISFIEAKKATKKIVVEEKKEPAKKKTSKKKKTDGENVKGKNV